MKIERIWDSKKTRPTEDLRPLQSRALMSLRFPESAASIIATTSQLKNRTTLHRFGD